LPVASALKRFERSAAVERLERLEQASLVYTRHGPAKNGGCTFSNRCYLNLSMFREFSKRFERSKAIERLERLERTNPRDERSKAAEPFDRTLGKLLERLERLELASV
jgi:hypothetical protein